MHRVGRWRPPCGQQRCSASGSASPTLKCWRTAASTSPNDGTARAGTRPLRAAARKLNDRSHELLNERLRECSSPPPRYVVAEREPDAQSPQDVRRVASDVKIRERTINGVPFLFRHATDHCAFEPPLKLTESQVAQGDVADAALRGVAC